jgi:hypothetical protein
MAAGFLYMRGAESDEEDGMYNDTHPNGIIIM